MKQPTADETDRLAFDDDPGSARSTWVAAGLVVALLAWMGSGFIWPSTEEEAPPAAEGPRPVAVAVKRSEAEAVTQFLSAEGQAVPERDTVVRSEAGGEVAEVLAERGADVEAGGVIARIAPAEREAELARAEEEVRRTERDLSNAETLLQRGASTVDRVAAARTALAAAQAQLSAAENLVEDTVIRAPFAGRLENVYVEEGEFVATGGEVARVVDLQPLTVEIQVPQQALRRVEVGQPAEVRFITGEVREGTVVFLGASAAAETRTFEAEIEVPNEDGAIPAGISAEVRVPTGEVVAHFLSPAILSLGPSGALGVKTVDAEDRVAFHEVDIVRAQTDGVWVSGLPQSARIITVGQGFVSAGEEVLPREDDVAVAETGGAAEHAEGAE